MQKPFWIDKLFETIDSKNAEKFVMFLSENAVFKFGNNPAARGREAIKRTVHGFFMTINALSHNITNTWAIKEHIICQGEVTYTRKDNTKITLPFVNIFVMKESLIKEYLIYIDINPLYAS